MAYASTNVSGLPSFRSEQSTRQVAEVRRKILTCGHTGVFFLSREISKRRRSFAYSGARNKSGVCFPAILSRRDRRWSRPSQCRLPPNPSFDWVKLQPKSKPGGFSLDSLYVRITARVPRFYGAATGGQKERRQLRQAEKWSAFPASRSEGPAAAAGKRPP
ncbi:uncharacterized protein LOC116802414 [Drosophila sechellia]|uniref:uncharacterized protein LOC116802414 n=1 Tax=Drosophila sechellia TaxID=7238 RepID=UPI0013DE735E|nr:uncharacterized protein LOC116802414 [Drosophila sechellia]